MLARRLKKVAITSWTLAALWFGSAHALAWQLPGDLPAPTPAERGPSTSAPVVGTPLEIVTDEAVGGGIAAPSSPSSTSPPPSPAADAPRIQPAEEIIAQPVPVEKAPTDAIDDADAGVVRETASAADESPATPTTPMVQPTPLTATLFHDAEPGKTTLAELKQYWGEPAGETATQTGRILTYAIEPFSRIEAAIAGDVLQSITIYFAAPMDIDEVAEQLGLQELHAVEIHDAAGTALGANYPERGVTFTYPTPEKTNEATRIVLEPLSAEPLLIRVSGDRDNRWQRDLADLQAAAALNQRDDRVWWLKAEILYKQAEFRDAAIAIERAIAVRPDSDLYQLTAARLIAEAGSFEDAIAATEAVLREETTRGLLKARAALQLGDLLAQSPRHDYAQALKMHQHAIQLALPLASRQSPNIRRAAKHLLVDAHMAIATDVAQGVWQKKKTVVPQWLDRAAALADDYVEHEQGDASIELDILCKRLDAYAWLEGQLDPSAVLKTAQAKAKTLREDARDATFQRHIDWALAKALIDAVDIERSRGNSEQALAYGESAEKAMTKLAAGGWNAERTQFQLSRLYFLLGSIQAVQLEDHAAAVKWFDKGMDDISRPAPDADLARCARRGQWMVSMGVSYWQTDQHDTALRLTKLGAALLNAAHEKDAVDASALAAPYNNLAFMHEQLGQTEQAKRFAELATQAGGATQR